MKEDLRIVKTKTRLSNALLDLAKTKPIKEIKISELCSLAKVSRATFYNNFQSVEEVFIYYVSTFEKPLEELLSKEMNKVDSKDRKILSKMWMSFLFPLVEELEKKRDDFIEILSNQSIASDFYIAFLKLLTGVLTKMIHLFHMHYDLEIPDDIAIPYLAGGLCDLLIHLVKQKDNYTLEEKQYFVYHLVFEMANYFFENHQSGEKKNG